MFTIFYQRMLAIYLKFYHDVEQSDKKKSKFKEPEEKWSKRPKSRKKKLTLVLFQITKFT